MNYIGGIEGMNFTPISNYNKMLNSTKSFDVDQSETSSFDKILNQQVAMQSPQQIKGGVEVSDFDKIMSTTMDNAQNNNSQGTVGNYLNNLSASVGKGMNAVNDKMKAAERAQEAFAMGDDSVSVHDVMIAAEKSSLSFQMAMQLRNKMVNAYTEINQIRV